MIYLTIAIPTYNEAKTISKVVREHIQVIKLFQNYQFEVLIYDDGSYDSTEIEINNIDYSSSDNFYIRVLKNDVNQGLIKGLEILAAEAKGKFIYVTSADGQFDSLGFKQALELQINDNLELVVLKRINKFEIYSFSRIIVSLLYLGAFKIITGVNTIDPGSTKIILRDLYIIPTSCTTLIKEAEILSRYIKTGKSFGVVPIKFSKRTAGKSKVIRLRTFIYIINDLAINLKKLVKIRFL